MFNSSRNSIISIKNHIFIKENEGVFSFNDLDDYFIETACIPEWLMKKLIYGGYNSHRKVRLFEIEAPFPTRKARVINRYKEKTGNDMTIEQVMRIDKTEKLQNSLYSRFKTLLNERVIKSHHIYHNIELDKIDEIVEQIDLDRYDGQF